MPFLHGAQVSGEKEFFANLVVDAVSKLDIKTLDLRMVGMKKVQVRTGHTHLGYCVGFSAVRGFHVYPESVMEEVCQGCLAIAQDLGIYPAGRPLRQHTGCHSGSHLQLVSA